MMDINGMRVFVESTVMLSSIGIRSGLRCLVLRSLFRCHRPALEKVP